MPYCKVFQGPDSEAMGNLLQVLNDHENHCIMPMIALTFRDPGWIGVGTREDTMQHTNVSEGEIRCWRMGKNIE